MPFLPEKQRKKDVNQHFFRCSTYVPSGDPYGNRTHVFAVRGRCLSRLTNGPRFSEQRYYSIPLLKKQPLFEKTFGIRGVRGAGSASYRRERARKATGKRPQRAGARTKENAKRRVETHAFERAERDKNLPSFKSGRSDLTVARAQRDRVTPAGGERRDAGGQTAKKYESSEGGRSATLSILNLASIAPIICKERTPKKRKTRCKRE